MAVRWLVVLVCCGAAACSRGRGERAPAAAHVARAKGGKIVKTDREWREQLTPEQFEVTRRAGTERPGTGKFHKHDVDGVYTCSCCGHPLFGSDAKYESGSGWPSFWKALSTNSVAERVDDTFGMIRTEVLCPRCDAHLGHVFEDGPEPTGLRYCINSLSLGFEPSEKDGE